MLSRDDEELIEAEISTKQKTHLLIDILSKKVPKGFDELVKSLIQDKTQIHLAEMLNTDYEQKKRISKCLVTEGCGNNMPDLSDLVPFHSGQVRNFYLLVLGQVKINVKFYISYLDIIMNACMPCRKQCRS